METSHDVDVKSDHYLTVPCARAKEELESVLADPQFQCSERNRKFLRFISEELFAGREGALKAYSIAVDVFGRPPSFDASTDPIVRIEATRLRSALARYYELHGLDRAVSIELPKGRYVPVFSQHGQKPIEWGGDASGIQSNPITTAANRSFQRQTIGRSAIIILKGQGLAVAALLVVALSAGFYLLGGLNHPAISERPSLSVELMPDGPDNRQAINLRDTLMSALSGFSTLRLQATDAYNSSTVTEASVAPSLSDYRLVLKYSSDKAQKTVWWQVIDQKTGEAIQSDDDHVRVDAASSTDPVELLASRLAVRIASLDGVINAVATNRDLEHPTLGNGCVLRANLALGTRTAESLEQARQCLERTLQQRPYDADAHAMLTPILLSIDPQDDPTDLTASAHEHADRAVALAPESSRSFAAKMMAEFRIGHVEAAISAGRQAMDINPYNTRVAATFARILYSTGERNEALKLASQALEVDGVPLADAEWTLAFDAYRQGRFDEVLLRLQHEANRPCYLTDLLRTAALGRLGREDEASEMVSGIRRAHPDFEGNFHADMSRRHLDPQLATELGQGLQLAGLRLR